jgi:hypothetical protein
MRPFLYDFFKENNRCLYGPEYELAFDEPGIERIDALPIRPLTSDERPHVPGSSSWEKIGFRKRQNLITDGISSIMTISFPYGSTVARLLGEEIGSTSSEGRYIVASPRSVYGNPIEYLKVQPPAYHIIKIG